MRSRRRDGADSALDGRPHAVTAAAAPRTSSLRRSWPPRGHWQAAGSQDELLALFREEEERGRGRRAGGVVAGAHDAASHNAGARALLRRPGFCRARRGRRSSASHACQAARRCVIPLLNLRVLDLHILY
jgi:hypothetical protein